MNFTDQTYKVSVIQTEWSVITGAPSSGITSLGYYLHLCGFMVLPECSRVITDLGRGHDLTTAQIRADQVDHERRIIALQHRAEQHLDPQQRLFIERGIPDTVAYGLPNVEMLARHPYRYKHIFFLQRLAFEQDYCRTESEAEAEALGQSFERIYRELNYSLTYVPKAPISDRAAFIFDVLGVKSPPLPQVHGLCRTFFTGDEELS